MTYYRIVHDKSARNYYFEKKNWKFGMWKRIRNEKHQIVTYRDFDVAKKELRIIAGVYHNDKEIVYELKT